MYMYITYVHKTFCFRKHVGTVLRAEIRTTKFCTEVFVILILHSMRSFYLNNIAELFVTW